MGNRRLFSLIFVGMVLSAASLELKAQDSDLVTADRVVNNEIGRRKGLLTLFSQEMSKASDLRKAAQFEAAKRIYETDIPPILNQLGDYATAERESLEMAKEELERVWAQYEFDLAEDLIAKKDYVAAIPHLNSANEILPSDKYKKRIEDCNRILKAKDYRMQTDLDVIDPQNAEFKDEINTLLGQAKTCYTAGNFFAAKDYCEQVYILDPYNPQAAYLLDQVYRAINRSAEARRYADNEERMAEVRWKWQVNIPIKDKTVRTNPNSADKTDGFRSDMYDKLNTIIFPSIDYEGISIRDVIATLTEDSKLYDPKRKGILINSNISTDQIEKYPKISMQLTNIPIGEVIRYVCLATGLKYEVRLHDIFIGEEVQDMDRQSFSVYTSVITRILASVPDESGETIAEEDPWAVTKNPNELPRSGNPDLASSKKLRTYFTQRGIQFPEKATVYYSSRSGKLHMTNTRDNLRRTSDLLMAIGDELPLVLIESKFLEVSQRDLEQLGFHWSLTKTFKTATDPNNPTTGDLIPGKSATQLPQADDILYSSGDVNNSTGFNDVATFAATVVPNAGPDNNINLNLSIIALNQKDITESLAAPKVTTTSGTEAVIRMVRQEYYPTSWTQPEIRSTSVGVTLEPAIPEFGDPTDIGIVLRVTPRVAPNNHTIELELAPSITEFEAWEEYTYYVTVPGSPLPTEQVIKMARISYREFTSKIRVYNGETIVLGGVLKDETAVNDFKYPFLGDLPLVGRFFRDYRYESTKTNLLIFVTARLVRSDGVPSKPLESTGRHDYNR